MTKRHHGVLLLVVGVVLSQYGYLHDLIWQTHDGAIYMGPRSYLLVVAGLAAVFWGCSLLWRASRR
jgi:hypothetical protein